MTAIVIRQSSSATYKVIKTPSISTFGAPVKGRKSDNFLPGSPFGNFTERKPRKKTS